MKKFWSFLLILLMVSCCGCSKPPQTLTVSVYGGETEINHYIDDIMERYDFILDRGLEVGGMYEFRHINGHIEVFLDGEFQFSADTMQEAYSELKAG